MILLFSGGDLVSTAGLFFGYKQKNVGVDIMKQLHSLKQWITHIPHRERVMLPSQCRPRKFPWSKPHRRVSDSTKYFEPLLYSLIPLFSVFEWSKSEVSFTFGLMPKCPTGKVQLLFYLKIKILIWWTSKFPSKDEYRGCELL